MKRRILCLVLALITLFTLLPFAALADGVEKVSYQVTYCQSEARKMLNMVNEFRTGSGAWQWNSDNTEKIYLKGLETLSYDYTLEKIAMERAVEIAICFSHTRPDSTDWYTAYGGYGKNSWRSENIGAGYKTAAEAFAALKETDQPYKGQGHRRSMLDSDHSVIGIACVKYNGYYFWVQEFAGVKSPDTKEVTANNSTVNVNVNIDTDLIVSNRLSADVGSSYTVTEGKSVDLPNITAHMRMKESWPDYDILPDYRCIVTPKCKWTSSDTSVVKISGGKLVGVKPGSAVITATALGKEKSITVKVKEVHHHSYTAKLSEPTCLKKGYTLNVCSCGDSYKSKYTEALGHSYKNGVCIRCGIKKSTSNPFEDVASKEFYYAPVIWAYNHKPQITSGMDKTHFKPNDSCTRAQIVTFLWRANGCPAPSGSENPFKDVSSKDYYYKAVLWAVGKGITTGVDKNHFSPNATCTRAHAVTFLWRADGKPDALNTKCPFMDVKSGEYYYDAVLWAVENEITSGMTESKFEPLISCTRAQIVTFLYRDIT